jgi:hypothetical protein
MPFVARIRVQADFAKGMPAWRDDCTVAGNEVEADGTLVVDTLCPDSDQNGSRDYSSSRVPTRNLLLHSRLLSFPIDLGERAILVEQCTAAIRRYVRICFGAHLFTL